MFRILSLDGGGIKGAFTASVLAQLEEDTQCAAVEHFDLITGTSTGGIIAIGLGLGIPAREILTFYRTQGPVIFPGTSREETKQRFLRGQIDILVCTDAAAEGLNLQTADYLVNFDLPWNPAKVEQRIGRIDRIGQRHTDIYVQNFCYLGSVEEIVYGRLLNRLGNMIAVVGEQQLSMLPVTEEDFRKLAQGEITERDLEEAALQRVAITQRRIRETELTGGEVYEIYQRLAQNHSATPLPVTLDGIWTLLRTSPYLRAAGCTPSANRVGNAGEALLLAGLPDIPDGTALTIDRALFDEGVESLGPRLRFASYGEPVFDALLDLTRTWPSPPGVRRISIQPAGLPNEYVGYLVAVQAEDGGVLRLITSLDQLEAIEVDENREISGADTDPFVAELHCLAAQELKLTAHVAGIEADNELSGRAQAGLALGVAYGLVAGRQHYGNAEANFWKELDGLRGFIAERTANGGTVRVLHIPACFSKVAATAFLPFEVKQRISDDTFWVERAPAILLEAAVDAATRVADGMKRKKSELTTEAAAVRLQTEMERLV